MESIEFLELADVVQIHIDQIDNYGGTKSIRDTGLLESAIEQPRAMFDGAYLHALVPWLCLGTHCLRGSASHTVEARSNRSTASNRTNANRRTHRSVLSCLHKNVRLSTANVSDHRRSLAVTDCCGCTRSSAT